MATNTCDQTQGYQSDFIDSVPEDFYCKKCTLVARRLTICSSCMESYCYACISDTQKQGQPCPTCGEEQFQALPQVKYQKRMKELRVYCSMKERGCGWTGTLDQLDTHLDPDQDSCQYVDTKCPLNCPQTIPKNKVEQHVAQHCAKRPYVCQHCNFKATYEEVVDAHLPECKYVPLQCPNLCGVTFERDFMEDHMKMCRLEEVECEFSGVGCEERFRREDQEEHTRQNSQKHLTLTASLAKQLQQKLEEQDKKHREEELTLRKKMEEHELEKKMVEQDKKHREEELTLRKKMEEQEKELEKKMVEQDKKHREEELTLRKKMEEQEKELEKKMVEQDKKHREEELTLRKKMEEQEKELEKKMVEQDKKHREEELTLRKKMEEQEKELQKKMVEQDMKHREEELMQRKKMEEQEKELEKKMVEQDKVVEELKQNLKEEQEQKLKEQEELMEKKYNHKFQELEETLKELKVQLDQNEAKNTYLISSLDLKRTFKIENYSIVNIKKGWNSPAMYTHKCGYKFYVKVVSITNNLYVHLHSVPGEFDGQLNWPAKVKLTIELVNQRGKNTMDTGKGSWNKPAHDSASNLAFLIVHILKLDDFLDNDTLYFYISKVELL